MPRTLQLPTFLRSSGRRRLRQHSLQLSLKVNREAQFQISEALIRLPQLTGGLICIYARPELTAHRGKLLSRLERGTPVHAASFVRKREIILETELLAEPRALRLILIHELFHFVWGRLGNGTRNAFGALLLREFQDRARGELGESSSRKKQLLRTHGQCGNSRLWRDYVCESFCDTAAWVYSGTKRDESFTLAKRWSERRKAWFRAAVRDGCMC